jgi:ABC-type glutathione transport system ATPase component
VSLEIPTGSTLGLVGASGCGKSTIARVIAGLAKPSAGSIYLDGVELTVPRTRAQARRVQMVFQDPSSALNPSMSIWRTMRELLHTHELVSSDAAARARSEELLDMVELPVSVLNNRPRQLSGGQRQRVGIARALALEPDLLIADEAVSALDVSVQASVLNTLRTLKAELSLTMLFISHDLAVTRYVSDEIAVMHRGRLVEEGDPDTVMRQPTHEYTKELVAASPRLDGPRLGTH